MRSSIKLCAVLSLLVGGRARADALPPSACPYSGVDAGTACDTAGPGYDEPGVCILTPDCPTGCAIANQCAVDGGCYLDSGSPAYFNCEQAAATAGTTTGAASSGTTGSSSGTTGSSCSTMACSASQPECEMTGFNCTCLSDCCACQPLGDGTVGTNATNSSSSGASTGGKSSSSGTSGATSGTVGASTAGSSTGGASDGGSSGGSGGCGQPGPTFGPWLLALAVPLLLLRRRRARG